MKKIAILLILTVVSPLSADWLPPPAFDCGDAVVVSYTPTCLIDPPPPPSSRISRHNRNAALLRDVAEPMVTAMTFARNSIYVANFGYDGSAIAQLDAFGASHPFVKFNTTVVALTPAGLTDLLAITYVGHWELSRIDANGTITDRIALPDYDHSITAMDLAADQCTLFYATWGAVERFDICRKAPLPRFATTPYSQTVRVLPDGGALVSSFDHLYRYDATGNRVSDFKLADEIGAVTLDTNPSIAWIVTSSGCSFYGNARVFQININLGSILTEREKTPLPSGIAIAVMGEWHASTDKVATPRRRAVH